MKPMATVTAVRQMARAWPARLARASISLALLGLFVLAVADVSTWWRTRDAAELAVTALADVGHYPMEEMPPLTVALIERFLERRSGTSSGEHS